MNFCIILSFLSRQRHRHACLHRGMIYVKDLLEITNPQHWQLYPKLLVTMTLMSVLPKNILSFEIMVHSQPPVIELGVVQLEGDLERFPGPGQLKRLIRYAASKPVWAELTRWEDGHGHDVWVLEKVAGINYEVPSSKIKYLSFIINSFWVSSLDQLYPFPSS